MQSRKKERAKALQGPFLGVGMTAVRKREHRNEISVLLLFVRRFPITIGLSWEYRLYGQKCFMAFDWVTVPDGSGIGSTV